MLILVNPEIVLAVASVIVTEEIPGDSKEQTHLSTGVMWDPGYDVPDDKRWVVEWRIKTLP